MNTKWKQNLKYNGTDIQGNQSRLIKLLLKNLNYNGTDRTSVKTTQIVVYLYKKLYGHELYTELLELILFQLLQLLINFEF